MGRGPFFFVSISFHGGKEWAYTYGLGVQSGCTQSIWDNSLSSVHIHHPPFNAICLQRVHHPATGSAAALDRALPLPSAPICHPVASSATPQDRVGSAIPPDHRSQVYLPPT